MSNLRTLELTLVVPEGVKVTQSIGSVLHGYLMSLVDSDYVDVLHRQQLRPYSQYIYYDKNKEKLLWRVSAYNEEAIYKVLEPLYNSPCEFYLKQKAYTVAINSKEIVRESSYKELVEGVFTSSNKVKSLDFTFLTSTSFKAKGAYVIFPESKFVIGSLLRKWNLFCDAESMKDSSLLKTLTDNVFVSNYHLSLQPFALEGTKIHAFRGTYGLGVKHNLITNKLLTVLANYSVYTGIGIKTALGMGGTEFTVREYSNDEK